MDDAKKVELLFQKVEMDDGQRAELERWCGIIGCQRYLDYANMIGDEKIAFDDLKECAIYDHDFCVTLYSVFRFVEYSFITVCEENGSIKEVIERSKEKYKTENEVVDFSVLADEVNKIKDEQKDFRALKNFRNDVMHHKFILNDVDKEQKVRMLVSFIEDTELREKKIKQINALAEKDGKDNKREPKSYMVRLKEANK